MSFWTEKVINAPIWSMIKRNNLYTFQWLEMIGGFLVFTSTLYQIFILQPQESYLSLLETEKIISSAIFETDQKIDRIIELIEGNELRENDIDQEERPEDNIIIDIYNRIRKFFLDILFPFDVRELRFASARNELQDKQISNVVLLCLGSLSLGVGWLLGRIRENRARKQQGS